MRLLYFIDGCIFFDTRSNKYYYKSAPGFFIRSLHKYFHEIIVMAPVKRSENPIKHGFGGSVESLGVDIVELPYWEGLAGFITKFIKRPVRIIKIILTQSYKADLVWVKHPSVCGLIIHVIAIILRKKIVLQIGGNILESWKSKKYYGWKKGIVFLLALVVHILIRFLSLFSANLLQGYKIQKLFNVEKENNTTFIFSQISKKDIFFRKDTCQNEVKVILFVGTLCHEKGILVLIEAVRQLRYEGYNVLLDVVGFGPLEQKIIEISKKKNCFGELIKYHRFIPFGEQLFEIYRQSDVFVLPTVYPEGFPRVVIEAWAFSVPVLVTNVSGIDRIVSNEKTGLIIEHDVKSIKENIMRIIDNGELRRKIIKNANDLVKKEYTLEIQAHHAMCHLKKVYPSLKLFS